MFKTDTRALKAAMAKRGYNLSMLAAASGISLTALSMKANSKTDFWGHEIYAISNALELTNYEIITIFFPRKGDADCNRYETRVV